MRFTQLDFFSVVQISGEDAFSFLQRQLTNDMHAVTSTKASFGAYLSPKGRIIANFIIILDGENNYYLILASDLVDDFVNRLKIFVFRDKVDIQTLCGMTAYGIQGAADSIESDVQLPDNDLETGLYHQCKTVRLPGRSQRFVILANEKSISSHNIQPQAANWFLQDVYAAIAWIRKANHEQYVPQAVNLDLIGAVSFVKGCYPGQEIVARLHYKGGVNHRMFQATCESATTITVGTKIECSDIPGNQTGTVVESQLEHDDGTQRLLVSLPLRFLGANELKLENATPIRLSVDQMPYTIPQLNKNTS